MTNHSNEWFNRNICYIFFIFVCLFVIVVCYFVFRSIFFLLAYSSSVGSILFILYTLCIWFSLLIEKLETVFWQGKSVDVLAARSMIFYQFNVKHVDDDEKKWECARAQAKSFFVQFYIAMAGSCISKFSGRQKKKKKLKALWILTTLYFQTRYIFNYSKNNNKKVHSNFSWCSRSQQFLCTSPSLPSTLASPPLSLSILSF